MAASVAKNPVFEVSEVARNIRNPKCEILHEKNSPQQEPSAEGFEDRAKNLKKINPDLCLVPDQNGRIALHVAVCNGQLEVISELINAKAESFWALTDEGQPILHLGVANNQLEAIKLLVERVKNEDFLKLKDKDGNTALHLAVAKRQIEIIRFLVSCPGLDVNATNENGDTALDVLMQSASSSCDDEIRKILQSVGAKARDFPGSAHLQTSASHGMATSMISPPRQRSRMTIGDGEEKRLKLLMVVAILTATMAFEAARNPPNANRTFRKEKHHDGNVTRSFCSNSSFFMATDAVGFLSSLSIIMMIIIRGPGMQALMGMMMIAISSMIVVFSCYSASHPFAQVTVVLWFGCVPFFLLSYLVLPFGKWLFEKYGVIGETKGQRDEEGMA